MLIERGEVYWVNFDPSIDGDIQKTRPAIIASNNSANAALNRVQVVPITSRTERTYPGDAIVQLGGEKRKAMTSQIATVSKQRLSSKLAKISHEDMKSVESAIVLQLGLK